MKTLYQSYFKRLIDIISGLIALPFVLIFMAIVWVLVLFDDRGPLFYAAPRMGKDGRIFKMYKFRSMKVDSPDLRNVDGSTFNGTNDPRVTKIGKFLRKTSIDEIPQLLNVLKGDMSLIGPRPSLTTTPYEKYNPVRRKRVSVRPGVTGYSQAYFRNSISQDDKFKKDCWYVDHITFVNDMKIIGQTILSVIKRDNIYINR